uniref:Transmembrane protein n=1 Tax=Panagrellus redivivus TaxID=6233 RepID=A0A7E4VA23_PANRE
MFFGLHDWLSEPTRRPNECCQCGSLKCRRLTLLILIFPFTFALGVLAMLLWTRLNFVLPVAIIGITVFVQILTLFIAMPAFFDERRYRWLIPLTCASAAGVAVWVLLVIIYIVKLIVTPNGVATTFHNADASIFLPGIPHGGLGERGEGWTENERNIHILGTILFLLPIQLFLCYVAYGVLFIFKARNGPEKVRYVQPKRMPAHVVILDQSVEEGIYGARSDEFRKGRP